MTREGVLLYALRQASLSPSGRELDLEAFWRTQIGPVTQVSARAALVRDAGHVRSEDLQGAMWLTIGTQW